MVEENDGRVLKDFKGQNTGVGCYPLLYHQLHRCTTRILQTRSAEVLKTQAVNTTIQRKPIKRAAR